MFVEGVWFTGYTTTERKFVEQTINMLAEAVQRVGHLEVTPESLKAGSFKHLAENTEAESRFMPSAIYLRDVDTIAGQVTTQLAPPIVKIRLDSVAAFQLGKMAQG